MRLENDRNTYQLLIVLVPVDENMGKTVTDLRRNNYMLLFIHCCLYLA
jgi:hypothetical protein